MRQTARYATTLTFVCINVTFHSKTDEKSENSYTDRFAENGIERIPWAGGHTARFMSPFNLFFDYTEDVIGGFRKVNPIQKTFLRVSDREPIKGQ